MANIQSPHGLLNIYQLLATIGCTYIPTLGFALINKADHGYDAEQTTYTIFDIERVETLRFFLERLIFPFKTDLIEIQLAVYHKNGYQTLMKNNYLKEYLAHDELTKDLLLFKAMHCCRSLLSGNQIKSYVLSNYTYHELPAEFWHYDEHWYRLLADGHAQCNISSIGDFLGDVYFKEEDVNRCVDSNPEESYSAVFSSVAALPKSAPMPSASFCSLPLINLEIYTTPWLQVQAAIYDEYGKDGLAQSSKDSVVLFIKEYIKKHELDISKSEVRFLATFMRLAEQKAGKKYHAELKLKKLNKK
jgi:hypothetical protein